MNLRKDHSHIVFIHTLHRELCGVSLCAGGDLSRNLAGARGRTSIWPLRGAFAGSVRCPLIEGLIHFSSLVAGSGCICLRPRLRGLVRVLLRTFSGRERLLARSWAHLTVVNHLGARHSYKWDLFLPFMCCACLTRRRYPPNGESFLTTFSDGCLGSNNDEGRSEV